jgi:hypothetical protein
MQHEEYFMNDMSIHAGMASGVMAAALQQQALGAQLIDKTLQHGAAMGANQAAAANPPHKGNELNLYV